MRKKQSAKDKHKKIQQELARANKESKARYARKKAAAAEYDKKKLLNDRREAFKPGPVIKVHPKAKNKEKVSINGEEKYLSQDEIKVMTKLHGEPKDE